MLKAFAVISLIFLTVVSLNAQSDNRPSQGPVVTGTGTNNSGPDRESAVDQNNTERQNNSLNRPTPTQGNIVQPDQVNKERVASLSEFPPEPNIPFQLFVARSVGEPLSIFGHNLFERATQAFTPLLEQISVPSDYVIGPGDELLIQTWGQIDTNFRGIVDRAGSIYLPTIGSLQVAGLRYEQLEGYLRNNITRVYKNFQISVTLGKLRSIRVLVVGQVRIPGTYTLSSLSTIVNALFAAGGPSKGGSMRDVQVRRAGKPTRSLDLYDLLTGGDESRDSGLAAGDVIYVPPVGHLVALAGDISIPAIYELKGHTTLNDVLRYAGGMTDTTDGDHVLIESVDDHRSRKVETVPIGDSGLNRELHGGDVVRFFSVSPKFENSVTLRGNVAMPGRYPWHAGLHVADLIPTRDVLITRNYWNRQNRLANPQMPPQNGMEHDSVVTVGSPRGIDDQLNQSATELAQRTPEINWDYAVIQRLDPKQLTTYLVPFNLGKAIDHIDPDNTALEPGDIITIFSQADMAVPVDQRSKFVRVDGEFKKAGVYQIQPNETLRQLVERAGGLSNKAYLYGAEFTRESTRIDQQARLDQYIRDLEQTVERGAERISSNDSQAQQQRIESQRRLVGKMKELRATGRIVLELKPGSNSTEELPNFELEDSDRLYVPFRPAVVGVIGAVYNGSSFVYRPNLTLGSYVRIAGGVTKDGDDSRIFVLRADGTTIGRQNHSTWSRPFSQLQMMPGDTIVVPEKLDKGLALQGLKDWTQIFSQFALGAAAITVFLK